MLTVAAPRPGATPRMKLSAMNSLRVSFPVRRAQAGGRGSMSGSVANGSCVPRGRAPRALCTAMALWFATVLLAIVPAPARAQGAGVQAATLLEDFVHFTLIAKPDLASAYGQQLLASGLADSELAELVENSKVGTRRFDEALARGLLIGDLEDIAAEIGLRVENGRLDLARERTRIEQAIDMLSGTQRERLLAERRLKAAGEYAVPSLLGRVTGGRDERQRAACLRMLREIGRVAVAPLCEALSFIDPASQRAVCELLGEIRYEHAAPYLAELALSERSAQPVREAADRAFRQILPGQVPLSVLFTNLAVGYFDGRASLLANPFEATSLVWRYDQHSGLVGSEVSTIVFGPIMAMRAAARAVGHDASNDDAVAMFVAANLRRERLLPAGEEDPVFGTSPYTAQFYATVYGTRIGQKVLAIGIDRNDTPLVRSAIAALAQTTGGSNLFTARLPEGRRPLVEAVTYPDRRVQYDAALALGRALPEQSFDGGQRVVSTLASAVRTGNVSYAIVIAEDDEERRVEAGRLSSLGFTVVAAERQPADAATATEDVPGIDLALVRMGTPEGAKSAVEALGRMRRTAATPVLIVAPGVESVALTRDMQELPRVAVTRPVGDDAMTRVIDALLLRAAGGRMTDSEAEIFAIESLAALRDIAVSRTSVFDIRDSEGALIDALDLRRGGVRMMVADILAMIDSETAQRRLIAAALGAADTEQIDLLERVADSIRRFGNRAESRQVQAIVQLVRSSSGRLAEAAGRVHGAMDLAGTSAADLIGRGR